MSEGSPGTLDTNSKAEGGNSILLWLAQNGPTWARIPAIIAGLLIAVVPTVLLLNDTAEKWMFHSADSAISTQLDLAASTKATVESAELRDLLSKTDLSGDDRKLLAQSVSEIAHEVWHLSNPKDEVKWTVFEKKSTNDYIGYKLFPSDLCLLISRIEKGAASVQWVRDPLRPTGDARATGSVSAARQVVFADELTTRLIGLSNRVEANFVSVRKQQPLQVESGPDHSPEAQGVCLNPHPWAYREDWGPYVNQCQQPVYRQFNDGCRHVQMFDHCTNTWGPVVWQFCVPNHHP